MKQIVLIIIACVVYFNALDNPFVFDDQVAIVKNESIRSWRTAVRPPLNTAVSARPLVNLSFAFNYAISGEDPRGYHVLNLAMHIVAGLLLLALLRRTLADVALSIHFLIVLIWMVHPLQTECINYVSQRSEVMMSCFYLAALYAAARALDDDKPLWWSIGSIAACAAGMLCKETMVTAPLMIWLWAWVFRRERVARHAALFGGLAATWVILVAVMLTWPRSESVGFTLGVGVWTYLLNQADMLCRYLQLAVYPHPLLIDYGMPRQLVFADVWQQFMFLASLVMAMLIGLRLRPKLGFAGAWFFLLLSPTSSIVPIVTEVGAERRMYLPLVAIVALFAMVGRRNPRTTLIVGAVIAAMFAGLSIQRNAQYNDPAVLWLSVVRQTPANSRAHNNLAIHYRKRDEHHLALKHFQAAADLKSQESVVYLNLGNALVRMDEIEKTDSRTAPAVAAFEKALQYDPENSAALNNLGILLARAKQHDRAMRYFQRAVQVNPDDDIARFNLAKLLIAGNRQAEAIVQLKMAIEVNPDNQAARRALRQLQVVQP